MCVLVSGVWRAESRSCKAILIKFLNSRLNYYMLPKVLIAWRYFDSLFLCFLIITIRYEWSKISSRVHLIMILILYGRESDVWDMISLPMWKQQVFLKFSIYLIGIFKINFVLSTNVYFSFFLFFFFFVTLKCLFLKIYFLFLHFI